MIRYFIIIIVFFAQVDQIISQAEWEHYPASVYNSQGILYSNPFIGGLNSPQFSEGDLNFDGETEIVLYERASKVWIVFERDGTELKYSREYSENMPQFGQDFSLLRDFNGDGKVDLIFNNNNTIEFWKNVGVSNCIFQKEKTLNDFVSGDPIFHRYFDLPGIEDVDGDGDLDLLIYGFGGDYLEYWKNYSQEYYSSSDSLVFQLANSCWGHFTENNSISDTFDLNLFDTCGVNVSNPQKMHVGSSITIYDYDGNGVQDLLMGDVGYSNLVLALNGGSSPNMNSSIDSTISSFPDNTVPVNIDRFPAAYWIDINNDGNQDLVVATNTDIQSNLKNSIHYYKNFGITGNTDLHLMEIGFLQNDMIDVGKQSYPVSADLNLDGYQDIVIGNYGEYDTSSNGYIGKLSVLMSVLNDSLYYIEETDFAELSSLNKRAIYPTFGDIDDDNDLDLIVGDELGQLSQGINIGTDYVFASILDDLGQIIDVGQNATPALFDLDNDFDLDLIIGNRNGLLVLYENIGSVSNPIFHKVTDTLGGVNVGANSVYGGFSKPCFHATSPDTISLLVSSYQGWVYEYSIVSSTGIFELVDSTNCNVGSNPSVCYADPDQDGEMEYLIGSERGGLSIFTDQDLSTSRIDENEIQIIEKEVVCFSFGNEIFLENLSDQSHQVFIWSIEGRLLTTLKINGNQRLVVNSPLSTGIYVVSSVTGGLKQKIVVD